MWTSENKLFEIVKNPNTAKERVEPTIIPVEERIKNYGEIKDTYTVGQAAEEAARCLKCPTHWCQKACPAGVPVTDFIAAVRAEDYDKAYKIIRTRSMLPEICSRVCPQEKQCQSNCTRSIRSQAVGIGNLERYAVCQHYASGGDEALCMIFDENGKKLAPNKHVAIIGTGPAGLSAAQRLIDMGVQVTLFDRNEKAGGLLEYGIPNMKLEKGVVQRRIKSLSNQGAQFKLGVNIGDDRPKTEDTRWVNLDAVEVTANYDAVILAAGTGNARTLNIEGVEGARGVRTAVEFLKHATNRFLDERKSYQARDRHVVIVGGGDTGNDCVGTAIREGAASVTQIEMLPEKRGHEYFFEAHPAKAKESHLDFSQEECKTLHGDPHVYQTTVKSIRKDSLNHIVACTLISLEPVYDEHFRLTMKEIPGTEKEIPCDMLVFAAGFIGPEDSVAKAFGVETNARTNIATTDYHTNVKKVYACGDCRTGQSLVVKAMSDGRDCADQVVADFRKK